LPVERLQREIGGQETGAGIFPPVVAPSGTDETQIHASPKISSNP
jgi:hypothetical protein